MPTLRENGRFLEWRSQRQGLGPEANTVLRGTRSRYPFPQPDTEYTYIQGSPGHIRYVSFLLLDHLSDHFSDHNLLTPLNTDAILSPSYGGWRENGLIGRALLGGMALLEEMCHFVGGL